MMLDGSHREVQDRADLNVRVTEREEFRHLVLSRGESSQRRRRLLGGSRSAQLLRIHHVNDRRISLRFRRIDGDAVR